MDKILEGNSIESRPFKFVDKKTNPNVGVSTLGRRRSAGRSNASMALTAQFQVLAIVPEIDTALALSPKCCLENELRRL